MKRLLLTTILLFTLGGQIFAQDLPFTFIYVRQDFSMSVELLKTQLRKAFSECQGNPFVVYYSGTAPLVMTADNFDVERLFGAITTLNSTLPISPLQEIECLSTILENSLQLQLSQDEFGYSTISSEAGYGSIDIKCYVGDDFVKSCINSVLARLLVVNNIGTTGGRDASITFFPCGADYGEASVQFNPQYGINTKPVIER